jgi:hypothetical protein
MHHASRKEMTKMRPGSSRALALESSRRDGWVTLESVAQPMTSAIVTSKKVRYRGGCISLILAPHTKDETLNIDAIYTLQGFSAFVTLSLNCIVGSTKAQHFFICIHEAFNPSTTRRMERLRAPSHNLEYPRLHLRSQIAYLRI